MTFDGGAAPETNSAPNNSSENNDRSLEHHLIFMRGSSLFTGLSQRECMEILSSGEIRAFAPNEVLFVQGQSLRSLILIRSGSVTLTKHGSNGEHLMVRMSGTGEIVNLPGESATYSARARAWCNALVWESGRLDILFTQYPQIRNNISHILAGQIRALEERVREIATEKVAKRLALVLLRLLKQIGEPCAQGNQVSVNRDELAQMTGTTQHTVSRVLSKWSEQGFIALLTDSVLIIEPQRLEAVSDE